MVMNTYRFSKCFVWLYLHKKKNHVKQLHKNINKKILRTFPGFITIAVQFKLK